MEGAFEKPRFRRTLVLSENTAFLDKVGGKRTGLKKTPDLGGRFYQRKWPTRIADEKLAGKPFPDWSFSVYKERPEKRMRAKVIF